ncbi:MAG TPA: multiheme c-type cytochrome [Polyangiaceae bacterium]
MRAVAFACLASACVGIAAMGAACDEHFPTAHPAADAGDDGGLLESQPPPIVAPELRRNASSSPVVFDPLRGGVWTANGDVGTVSYVDVDARTLVQELAVGQDIRSVALSPDATWVAAVDRAGATVTLIDAEARVARRTIALGGHPRACVWDAANPRWLYVAVEDDGAVVVIDRTLGQVVDSVPVGRLPSGLAVSSGLRELYVNHRIDAEVTVVDLRTRAVAADIPLADEPYSDVATPNGRPFAFEAAVLTADGRTAWMPHELLAPTHPFVFDRTLFPAISVIDVGQRVEVQTDPNSAYFDGRKNLFAAINLQGSDGQPEIFSQLCAVAMHPDGFIAWALACGSEDLLTFGVIAGAATEVLRDLPVDHPTGLALDDTGQRLFVLGDQSHQLLTIDTAGGSLVGHATIYGAPISLVAKDPVDPQLRAGLTLFFRASSAKGPLATTGNDWMSCGGCHLDGFGPTNLRLFEALQPHEPAVDAQIGHVGLSDHFASATTPAAFDPHDVLVALLDQGGLAPDRTGKDRSGQIDPAHPTADGATMAQQLARVVARDLPGQPTWLSETGGPPNLAWDTTFCGGCHPTEYAAWSGSVHAHAGEDPMLLYDVGVEQGIAGSAFTQVCVGCHDPVGARSRDYSLKSGRGVTCIGCHDVEREIRAGGNGDLQSAAHDWTQDHKARGLASLVRLRQPEFCGGCHQQFVPGTGLIAIGTLDEYHASPFAPATLCVDCHMPKDASGHADHHAAGGNVYMAQRIGDATLAQEQAAHLKNVLSVAPQRVAGGVLVTLRNVGAGHGFPTGVTDIRQPWVEIQAKDGGGNVLQRFGGPQDGLVPASAARLGIDIAGPDGTVLFRHELTEATRVPFDVRVPAGEAQALFVPLPASLPQGTASLEAVVVYGVVRATFYRDAVGDPAATAPSTEIARAVVP